jgi:hypothetical protein
MANLKNYRLINTEEIEQLVIGNKKIVLASITEQEAKFLHDRGSRYVEKIEAEATPKAQKEK